MSEWKNERVRENVSERMKEWERVWAREWKSGREYEWTSKWASERKSEWVSEWVKERMSKWKSKRVNEWESKRMEEGEIRGKRDERGRTLVEEEWPRGWKFTGFGGTRRRQKTLLTFERGRSGGPWKTKDPWSESRIGIYVYIIVVLCTRRSRDSRLVSTLILGDRTRARRSSTVDETFLPTTAKLDSRHWIYPVVSRVCVFNCKELRADVVSSCRIARRSSMFREERYRGVYLDPDVGSRCIIMRRNDDDQW